MKKILFYLFILGLFPLLTISCEKDEIIGTVTEDMAGEWFVTVVAVDDAGNVVYEDEDLYGLGHFHLDTYNTSADNESQMWIDDNGNFWEFKVKMNINFAAKTFQAAAAQNEYYDCQVTITDGKILENAATTPTGMPADSIVFHVNFSDDTSPVDYGFAKYRVAGFRYTGFANDEDH